jgi:hypothetical protein
VSPPTHTPRHFQKYDYTKQPERENRREKRRGIQLSIEEGKKKDNRKWEN